MDSPANVKAIMARFNTGTGSAEGSPNGSFSTRAGSTEEVPGGRPKVPLHPTLSSGPPAPVKKLALESSLSGGAFGGGPKPNFLKSSASAMSAPELCEFPRPKPLPGKFGAPQEEGKPAVAKPPAFKPKPSEVPRDSEPKPQIPKPPVLKPPPSSAPEGKVGPKPPPAQAKPPPALTKPHPVLTKPPLAAAKPPPSQAKPSWVKDDHRSEDSGAGGGANPPRVPQAPKPSSSLIAMRAIIEAGGAKPTTPLKPSSIQAAQSLFNKESSDTRGPEKSSHMPQGSHDPPVPKPSFGPRASFVKRQQEQKENSDPSAPKRNPLLNKLALGTPPAKPNRPPNVNLEKFRKQTEPQASGPGMKKGSLPPPPGPLMAPPLPSHASAPSLPPRPTAAIIQPDPDENYDDVGVINSLPPPLPPGGHPSQAAEDSESDGEMYEDLDERWATTESKEQEKKREKEEKKRFEQEKKEQREREKKEQDARKKFKLSGPVQVIHKLKAKVDCKGSKTDLALKQGDLIEIIRISDNPEGRWLGRTREGSFGYVKTESVEIDFDALKRQGETLPVGRPESPELYDDIGVQEDVISVKGPGVALPPPPEDGEELYDMLDDLDLNVSATVMESRPPAKLQGLLKVFKTGWEDWKKGTTSNNEIPPPPQFTAAGGTEKQEEPGEEIYDDVDSPPAPPPPPAVPAPSLSSLGSLLQMQLKAKTEEKDLKKQKRLEKEEKEFRKKFKFDGEIQVLYQVTIVSTLTNKKWGNKDLPLRPGETVDVIVKPTDNKLIGRNEEGKFGYVSTSHIVAEDADIYDDIGEDCIYDND